MPTLTSRALEERLTAALPGCRVAVKDDTAAHAGHPGARGGGHYRVHIRWTGFGPMSRLERQRHVHSILADMLADSRIHALSLELAA